jgi:hypothetical protein
MGFHGDSGIWMKFGVPVEFAYQNILGEVREKLWCWETMLKVTFPEGFISNEMAPLEWKCLLGHEF